MDDVRAPQLGDLVWLRRRYPRLEQPSWLYIFLGEAEDPRDHDVWSVGTGDVVTLTFGVDAWDVISCMGDADG